MLRWIPQGFLKKMLISVVWGSLYKRVSSFFPARVPWLRTGKNDTIPVAGGCSRGPATDRWKQSAGLKKKSSFLEANRAKPSCRMNKQVPKNGIIDATVDSERGWRVVWGSLHKRVSSFFPARVTLAQNREKWHRSGSSGSSGSAFGAFGCDGKSMPRFGNSWKKIIIFGS